MKKIIVVGIILLFLGSSVPALAKTQSSEHYKVYIGAGVYHEHEGKIGYGWHMTVENDGDTTITVVRSYNETTLSGKVLFNSSFPPISLPPGGWTGCGGADFYPIARIYLTVVVGNMTYSKTGYMIGPFVLLVG
jgi:hypothetical protein